MKKLVYVAGPISKGPYWINVRNGIDMGQKIRQAGMVPFIPHLDFLWVLIYPETTWEDNLVYDEEIILRCQAILRLPGESKGADREEAFALAHGIPVFHEFWELKLWNENNADPEFKT
jgi:hypothetical protein